MHGMTCVNGAQLAGADRPVDGSLDGSMAAVRASSVSGLRHPAAVSAALARMAREHVSAALDATRQWYRTARVQLIEAGLPPHVIEQVMEVCVGVGSLLSPLIFARSRSSMSPSAQPREPE